MIAYPKTENLFARDPETHKLTGELRREEFALVDRWHVQEKIDGTNVRLVYDPLDGTAEVRGRSDRASVHPEVTAHVLELFPLAALDAQFVEYLGPGNVELGARVTIFGEAYGAGIQKGGAYAPVKLFRMFDVLYSRPGTDRGGFAYQHSWCNPSTVEWIADQLGVPTPPVIGYALTREEVVREVRSGLRSQVAYEDGDRPDVLVEGVVARTDPYLFTHGGSRLVWKLKGADL